MDGVDRRDEYLEACGKLRIEKEREKQIAKQAEKEMRLIRELDEKLQTLAVQVTSVKEASAKTSPLGQSTF